MLEGPKIEWLRPSDPVKEDFCVVTALSDKEDLPATRPTFQDDGSLGTVDHELSVGGPGTVAALLSDAPRLDGPPLVWDFHW